MPIVKLESSDGDVFEVDLEIAKCSTLIKDMIEHLGFTDDEVCRFSIGR